MRPDTSPLAIPALVDQLKASERSVRLGAAAALGAMGANAEPAVPGLIEALRDPDVHVRKMAALTLGDLGSAADMAVPALIEALADEHESVRRRAAVALGDIGGSQAMPALRQLRNDPNRQVGQVAARALAEMAGGITRAS
jgi:HEAT repeat protein